MGHAALSNLLGGIGVWHGSCKMRSHLFSPPDSVKPYGPLSLMSAVPSRTGFPRGFIWDEVNFLFNLMGARNFLKIISPFRNNIFGRGFLIIFTKIGENRNT